MTAPRRNARDVNSGRLSTHAPGCPTISPLTQRPGRAGRLTRGGRGSPRRAGDRMQEITPHVTSLHVDLKWFPQPYPPNVFLISEGGAGALIDSGFGDDDSYNKRIEFLQAHSDVTIKYIVLTHHH